MKGLSVLQDDVHKIQEIASRMLDAGAPGIARKLRLIPERIEKSEDWTEWLACEFGELLLFVKYFEHLDKLDANEKEDLLRYAGIIFKKTDFPKGERVHDEWMYLGHVKEHEEKLLIRRNWFYGLHTKRMAMLLEFQFNRFTSFKPFKTGTIYRCGVQFFPSKLPLRIKDMDNNQVVRTQTDFSTLGNINQLLDEYATAVSANPFLRHQCFLLGIDRISRQGQKWFVSTNENQGIEISNDVEDMPYLLAFISGGYGLFACEYFENKLRILSCLKNQFVFSLKGY